MARLNIVAGNETEKIILDYLEHDASECLVDKINQGTKTLADCMNYIKQEAKKLAVGGCAAVADSTVFGWAVHFFEEDSIKAPEKVQTASVQVEPKKEKKTEVKKQTPQKKDPKEEPQLPGQMNILDFLGGM